jgi:hypothetical protein
MQSTHTREIHRLALISRTDARHIPMEEAQLRALRTLIRSLPKADRHA